MPWDHRGEPRSEQGGRRHDDDDAEADKEHSTPGKGGAEALAERGQKRLVCVHWRFP